MESLGFRVPIDGLGCLGFRVAVDGSDPRMLEHGFTRIRARVLHTVPAGHEDNNVPTFWLLL